MGRAIKLILYYLAYQLLFIFLATGNRCHHCSYRRSRYYSQLPPRDNGNIHRYVTLRISHDMALGTFPLCQVQ